MRFTLDANVLVYAADRDAGERHRVALDVVRRARHRDCVLTLQALAELFRALTGHKHRVAPERAAAIVQDWRDALPVVAADEASLTDAIDAVIHHSLSFWDAMLWATAKHHGCRYVLLSEDGQHGRAIGGVTLVNPFAGDAGDHLRAVLD